MKKRNSSCALRLSDGHLCLQLHHASPVTCWISIDFYRFPMQYYSIVSEPGELLQNRNAERSWSQALSAAWGQMVIVRYWCVNKKLFVLTTDQGEFDKIIVVDWSFPMPRHLVTASVSQCIAKVRGTGTCMRRAQADKADKGAKSSAGNKTYTTEVTTYNGYRRPSKRPLFWFKCLWLAKLQASDEDTGILMEEPEMN